MRPLTIGVNALYLIPGGVGGTEIYLRALLAALAEMDPVNRYVVFTNRETGADLAPEAPNFTVAPQPVRAAWRPARILWEQTWLPLAALAAGLDVLLNPGFTAPLACPCPQVTVFHDLQHKRHPEYFRWFDLPFWRFLLFWSAHISRLVLAASDATAADLVRFYRLPPGRFRTVPLGVEPVFLELGRRRRPERFLLSVSTLHPHKNLDGLLHAFAEFRREQPEFRLVVTGIHGYSSRPLHELRDSLGLKDAVDFPGWISRDDLLDLYTRAWAFLYPSRFEGFGMPILEALAAAVPTACSAIEPLATLAGGAALTFDPHNPAAAVDAIRRIVCDEPLRRRLAEDGPRQAARFPWSATARATLDALVEISRPAGLLS